MTSQRRFMSAEPAERESLEFRTLPLLGGTRPRSRTRRGLRIALLCAATAVVAILTFLNGF